MNKAIAELIGTFIFVLFGLGAIVLGGAGAAGALETALAFGFALIAAVVLVGAISGAHVNPAVTLGTVLTGRITVQDAVSYWIAQIVGGLAGAAVLKLLLEMGDLPSDATQLLGGNVIPDALGTAGVFILEGLLAAAFVLVYLRVTDRGAPVAGAALTLGFTFSLTQLISYPVDNGGVNPARSIGAAIFETADTDALADLWLFILAPLVGAVLAAIIAPLLRTGAEEVEAPRETAST